MEEVGFFVQWEHKNSIVFGQKKKESNCSLAVRVVMDYIYTLFNIKIQMKIKSNGLHPQFPAL